jgi:hypothetical protein
VEPLKRKSRYHHLSALFLSELVLAMQIGCFSHFQERSVSESSSAIVPL